jgi:hypothetical protein
MFYQKKCRSYGINLFGQQTISRWLLLFSKYDFIVMCKPNNIHVVVNALSRLWNITEPIGVLNQTTNISLLYIGAE